MNILKKLFGRKAENAVPVVSSSEIDSETIQNKKSASAVKQYFRKGLFNKFVSVLVTVCFIISIVNLPAFAKGKSKYETKEKIIRMKKEGKSQDVSYTGDESSGSVNYMQSLSDNIEVKDGVIYRKADKEPIGTWDGETAKIRDGEGNLTPSKVYTDAVNEIYGNKKEDNSDIEGEEDNTTDVSDNQIENSQIVTKEVKGAIGKTFNATTNPFMAFVGDLASFSVKLNEKEYTGSNQTEEEQTYVKGIEYIANQISEDTQISNTEQDTQYTEIKENNEDTQYTQYTQNTQNEETENNIGNLEETEAQILNGNNEQEIVTTATEIEEIKTEPENEPGTQLGNEPETQPEGTLNITEVYGENAREIFDEITAQTGLNDEQIYNEFQKAGVTKEQFESVSEVLLSKVATIINCAVHAISVLINAVENIVTAGILAIQVLATDIVSGTFLKNNNKNDKQIMTSMYSMQKVLSVYGISTEGYECIFKEFMAALQPGESAIIYVNDNHYITVTKEEDGSFSVTDINVNSGNKVNYSVAEFTKLMNNQTAVGKDIQTGKEIVNNGYKAINKDGRVTVLTNSEIVAQKGNKISEDKLKTIAGARVITIKITIKIKIQVPYIAIEWRSIGWGISVPVPVVRIMTIVIPIPITIKITIPDPKPPKPKIPKKTQNKINDMKKNDKTTPKSPVKNVKTNGNTTTTTYQDGSKTTEYVDGKGNIYIRNYDPSGNYIGGSSYNATSGDTTYTQSDGNGGYHRQIHYKNGGKKESHTDRYGNETADYYNQSGKKMFSSSYNAQTGNTTITTPSGAQYTVAGQISVTAEDMDYFNTMSKNGRINEVFVFHNSDGDQMICINGIMRNYSQYCREAGEKGAATDLGSFVNQTIAIAQSRDSGGAPVSYTTSTGELGYALYDCGTGQFATGETVFDPWVHGDGIVITMGDSGTGAVIGTGVEYSDLFNGHSNFGGYTAKEFLTNLMTKGGALTNLDGNLNRFTFTPPTKDHPGGAFMIGYKDESGTAQNVYITVKLNQNNQIEQTGTLLLHGEQTANLTGDPEKDAETLKGMENNGLVTNSNVSGEFYVNGKKVCNVEGSGFTTDDGYISYFNVASTENPNQHMIFASSSYTSDVCDYFSGVYDGKTCVGWVPPSQSQNGQLQLVFKNDSWGLQNGFTVFNIGSNGQFSQFDTDYWGRHEYGNNQYMVISYSDDSSSLTMDFGTISTETVTTEGSNGQTYTQTYKVDHKNSSQTITYSGATMSSFTVDDVGGGCADYTETTWNFQGDSVTTKNYRGKYNPAGTYDADLLSKPTDIELVQIGTTDQGDAYAGSTTTISISTGETMAPTVYMAPGAHIHFTYHPDSSKKASMQYGDDDTNAGNLTHAVHEFYYTDDGHKVDTYTYGKQMYTWGGGNDDLEGIQGATYNQTRYVNWNTVTYVDGDFYSHTVTNKNVFTNTQTGTQVVTEDKTEYVDSEGNVYRTVESAGQYTITSSTPTCDIPHIVINGVEYTNPVTSVTTESPHTVIVTDEEGHKVTYENYTSTTTTYLDGSSYTKESAKVDGEEVVIETATDSKGNTNVISDSSNGRVTFDNVHHVNTGTSLDSLLTNNTISTFNVNRDHEAMNKAIVQAAAAIVVAAAIVASVFTGGLSLSVAFMVIDLVFAVEAAGTLYDTYSDYTRGNASLWDVGKAALILAISLIPSLGEFSKAYRIYKVGKTFGVTFKYAAALNRAGKLNEFTKMANILAGANRSAEGLRAAGQTAKEIIEACGGVSKCNFGSVIKALEGSSSIGRTVENIINGAKSASKAGEASEFILESASTLEKVTNTIMHPIEAFKNWGKSTTAYKFGKGIWNIKDVGLREGLSLIWQSTKGQFKNFIGLNYFKEGTSMAEALTQMFCHQVYGAGSSIMGLVKFQTIGGTLNKHVLMPVDNILSGLFGKDNIVSKGLGILMDGLGRQNIGTEERPVYVVNSIEDMNASEVIGNSIVAGLAFYFIFGAIAAGVNGVAGAGEYAMRAAEGTAVGEGVGASAGKEPAKGATENAAAEREVVPESAAQTNAASGNAPKPATTRTFWDKLKDPMGELFNSYGLTAGAFGLVHNVVPEDARKSVTLVIPKWVPVIGGIDTGVDLYTMVIMTTMMFLARKPIGFEPIRTVDMSKGIERISKIENVYNQAEIKRLNSDFEKSGYNIRLELDSKEGILKIKDTVTGRVLKNIDIRNSRDGYMKYVDVDNDIDVENLADFDNLPEILTKALVYDRSTLDFDNAGKPIRNGNEELFNNFLETKYDNILDFSNAKGIERALVTLSVSADIISKGVEIKPVEDNKVNTEPNKEQNTLDNTRPQENSNRIETEVETNPTKPEEQTDRNVEGTKDTSSFHTVSVVAKQYDNVFEGRNSILEGLNLDTVTKTTLLGEMFRFGEFKENGEYTFDIDKLFETDELGNLINSDDIAVILRLSVNYPEIANIFSKADIVDRIMECYKGEDGKFSGERRENLIDGLSKGKAESFNELRQIIEFSSMSKELGEFFKADEIVNEIQTVSELEKEIESLREEINNLKNMNSLPDSIENINKREKLIEEKEKELEEKERVLSDIKSDTQKDISDLREEVNNLKKEVNNLKNMNSLPDSIENINKREKQIEEKEAEIKEKEKIIEIKEEILKLDQEIKELEESDSKDNEKAIEEKENKKAELEAELNQKFINEQLTLTTELLNISMFAGRMFRVRNPLSEALNKALDTKIKSSVKEINKEKLQNAINTSAKIKFFVDGELQNIIDEFEKVSGKSSELGLEELKTDIEESIEQLNKQREEEINKKKAEINENLDNYLKNNDNVKPDQIETIDELSKFLEKLGIKDKLGFDLFKDIIKERYGEDRINEYYKIINDAEPNGMTMKEMRDLYLELVKIDILADEGRVVNVIKNYRYKDYIEAYRDQKIEEIKNDEKLDENEKKEKIEKINKQFNELIRELNIRDLNLGVRTTSFDSAEIRENAKNILDKVKELKETYDDLLVEADFDNIMNIMRNEDLQLQFALKSWLEIDKLAAEAEEINQEIKDGKTPDINKQLDLLTRIKDASINLQITGNLMSNKYGMSKVQYEAIDGIFNEQILKPLAEGKDINQKEILEVLKNTISPENNRQVNILGTGAGKTSIETVLFAALKTVNDWNGKYTLMMADINTNVSTVISRVSGMYGLTYEVEQADNNSIKNTHGKGMETTTKKALFMTYTDYAFIMLAKDTMLEGKVGIVVGDEADMTVYMSKVMMSEAGGFESERSAFSSMMVRLVAGDALSETINNIDEALKKDTIFKDLIETKDALDRYIENDYRGEEGAKQRKADIELLTKGDNAFVNRVVEDLKDIRNMIEDSEVRANIDKIIKDLENFDKDLSSLSFKQLELMQKALEIDVNTRRSKLLEKEEYKKVFKDEIRKLEDKLNLSRSERDGIQETGYTVNEILNNVVTSKMTWTEGIDYGIGKVKENGKEVKKVMLICKGELIDLVPGAGFKQIHEMELLMSDRADEIDGMTALGTKDSSSIAIIKAIREADGFIGLTGTYSASAKAAMDMGSHEYTDSTSVSIEGEDVTFERADGSEIEGKVGKVRETMFGTYGRIAASMLEGKGVIAGMNSQAEVDIFKDFATNIGVLEKVKEVNKNGDVTYRYFCKGEKNKEVAWFDADMKKSDGERYASNEGAEGKGSGNYMFFIGLNEQLGRGIDIQLSKKKAEKIILFAVNPHLMYKSGLGQYVGRVGGTRFSAQGTENIEIEFLSDKNTIRANADKHEWKINDISKIESDEYGKLTVNRVYENEGRTVEDKLVEGSLGRRLSSSVENGRQYVNSKVDLIDKVNELGYNGNEAFRLIKEDRTGYVYEKTGLLTERGSVISGYLVQALSFEESDIKRIEQISGETIYENGEIKLDKLLNALESLQRAGLLATTSSNNNSLSDILNVSKITGITTTELPEEIVNSRYENQARATVKSLSDKSLKEMLEAYNKGGIEGLLEKMKEEGIEIKDESLLEKMKTINRRTERYNDFMNEEENMNVLQKLRMERLHSAFEDLKSNDKWLSFNTLKMVVSLISSLGGIVARVITSDDKIVLVKIGQCMILKWWNDRNVKNIRIENQDEYAQSEDKDEEGMYLALIITTAQQDEDGVYWFGSPDQIEDFRADMDDEDENSWNTTNDLSINTIGYNALVELPSVLPPPLNVPATVVANIITTPLNMVPGINFSPSRFDYNEFKEKQAQEAQARAKIAELLGVPRQMAFMSPGIIDSMIENDAWKKGKSLEEIRQVEEQIEKLKAAKNYLKNTGRKGSNLYKKLYGPGKDIDMAVKTYDEFVELAEQALGNSKQKDSLKTFLENNGLLLKNGKLTTKGRILLTQILFLLDEKDSDIERLLKMVDESANIKTSDGEYDLSEIAKVLIKLQQEGIVLSLNGGFSIPVLFDLLSKYEYSSIEDVKNILRGYKLDGIHEQRYAEAGPVMIYKEGAFDNATELELALAQRKLLVAQMRMEEQKPIWNRKNIANMLEEIRRIEEDIMSMLVEEMEELKLSIEKETDPAKKKELQKKLNKITDIYNNINSENEEDRNNGYRELEKEKLINFEVTDGKIVLKAKSVNDLKKSLVLKAARRILSKEDDETRMEKIAKLINNNIDFEEDIMKLVNDSIIEDVDKEFEFGKKVEENKKLYKKLLTKIERVEEIQKQLNLPSYYGINVEELEKELDVLMKELAEVLTGDQLKNLEKTKKQIEKAIAEGVIERGKVIEEKKKEFRAALEKYEKESKQVKLEAEINKKENEIEKLTQTLDKKTDKLEEKENTLKLVEDLEYMENQLKAAEEKYAKKLADIEKYPLYMQETMKKNMDEEINRLKLGINRLKNELRGKVSEEQLNSNDFENIKKQIRNEISELEKEILNINDQIDKATKYKEQKQAEIDSLNEEQQTNYEMVKVYRKIITNLTMEEIEQEKEDNKNKDKNLSELTNQIENIRSEIESVSEDLNQIESSVSMEQSAEELEEELNKLQKELNELEYRKDFAEDLYEILFYLEKITDKEYKEDEELMKELYAKINSLLDDRILSKAIVGVTKPQDVSNGLKALFALFNNPDDIAEMFGYNSIEEVGEKGSQDDIISNYFAMLGRAETESQVELLGIARDMLLMICNNKNNKAVKNSIIKAINEANVDELTDKFIKNKAVNMNYVINAVTERKENGDFVIDLTKIKEVVEKPDFDFDMKAEDLLKKLASAFDSGNRNSNEKMKNALMSLSNIHAIQAAA